MKLLASIGLFALRSSIKMVGPVQNGQFEYQEEFRLSHLGLAERAQ